jgi:hypothetical protein
MAATQWRSKARMAETRNSSSFPFQSELVTRVGFIWVFG